MKLTAYWDISLMCGHCAFALYRLSKYLPRHIVICPNEKCPRFNVTLEVAPIELEVIGDSR
jgi:hypothetical protein